MYEYTRAATRRSRTWTWRQVPSRATIMTLYYVYTRLLHAEACKTTSSFSFSFFLFIPLFTLVLPSACFNITLYRVPFASRMLARRRNHHDHHHPAGGGEAGDPSLFVTQLSELPFHWHVTRETRAWSLNFCVYEVPRESIRTFPAPRELRLLTNACITRVYKIHFENSSTACVNRITFIRFTRHSRSFFASGELYCIVYCVSQFSFFFFFFFCFFSLFFFLSLAWRSVT